MSWHLRIGIVVHNLVLQASCRVLLITTGLFVVFTRNINSMLMKLIKLLRFVTFPYKMYDLAIHLVCITIITKDIQGTFQEPSSSVSGAESKSQMVDFLVTPCFSRISSTFLRNRERLKAVEIGIVVDTALVLVFHDSD